MTDNTSLVKVSDLEVLLKRAPGSLTDDPYTALVIRSAENVVRDRAQQPGWIGEPEAGPGQTVAPQRAKDIALWLASRAWSNRVNLQRRTAGPISETYFENGVYGLELTEAEGDYLDGQVPGGRRSGLWVQGIGGGGRYDSNIYLPGDRPHSDLVLMDDGSTGWAYGE